MEKLFLDLVRDPENFRARSRDLFVDTFIRNPVSIGDDLLFFVKKMGSSGDRIFLKRRSFQVLSAITSAVDWIETLFLNMTTQLDYRLVVSTCCDRDFGVLSHRTIKKVYGVPSRPDLKHREHPYQESYPLVCFSIEDFEETGMPLSSHECFCTEFYARFESRNGFIKAPIFRGLVSFEAVLQVFLAKECGPRKTHTFVSMQSPCGKARVQMAVRPLWDQKNGQKDIARFHCSVALVDTDWESVIQSVVEALKDS